MTLIFVTSNEHKYEEAEKLAEKFDIDIKRRNIPYIEVQADNLEEVVKPSAQQACKLAGEPCFVEDAGLFIDSLNGFPGPYSSYVFETLGNRGILKLMKGTENKRGEFRSAIGYCEPGEKPQVFKGKVVGTISEEIRGERGFGYDPIFMPERGEGGTFAEMSTEMKNNLSHRAEAIEKFVKWYRRNKMVGGG